MDSFGWCFIGCGGLAGRVARQIAATGRHRIVSVYARDEGHRAAFAGAWGARAADSAEQAVAAPGVDGVYIVTPHPSHCGYARLAVEMGKPVLCEKPFAVSAGEARALFRLPKNGMSMPPRPCGPGSRRWPTASGGGWTAAPSAGSSGRRAFTAWATRTVRPG